MATDDKEPDTANGTKLVEWTKWKLRQARGVYRPVAPLVDEPLEMALSADKKLIEAVQPMADEMRERLRRTNKEQEILADGKK